jgi:hypothetical protein
VCLALKFKMDYQITFCHSGSLRLINCAGDVGILLKL